MSAVGETHTKHSVAGIYKRHVGCQVGLCAGMGLDVGMIGSEQLTSAVSRYVFGNVNKLTAAVIAF